MDYEKAYKEALEKIREGLQPLSDGTKISGVTRAFLEEVFPELQESKDEKMWKLIKKYAHYNISDIALDADHITREQLESWLEKQGEQKSIMNVPSREVILAIWDLGNEWKELTNGSISTEYGTQLDYIQKHWHESEYYLREKQGEKKVTTIDFNAKDWYVSNIDGKIHNINISSEKQGEKKPTWSEEDEEYLRRAINATKDGYPMTTKWLKSLKTRLS